MTFISLENGKFEISSYSNGSYRYGSRGKPMSSETLRTMGLIPAMIQRIAQLEALVTESKPRPELIRVAEECGMTMTGKPDGSEAITIVFSVDAWRKFDRMIVDKTTIDVSKEYEELRALIDGGSESMTHEDAVKVLERTLFEHDRFRDQIEDARLALRDNDETPTR